MNERCEHCKYWTRNRVEKIDYEQTDWRDNKTKYYHSTYEYEPASKNFPYKVLNVENIPSKFGNCSNPKFVYTKAGGSVSDDDIAHNDKPDALLYTDGEAYGAYFLTGEAFGCVHFERSEAP